MESKVYLRISLSEYGLGSVNEVLTDVIDARFLRLSRAAGGECLAELSLNRIVDEDSVKAKTGVLTVSAMRAGDTSAPVSVTPASLPASSSTTSSAPPASQNNPLATSTLGDMAFPAPHDKEPSAPLAIVKPCREWSLANREGRSQEGRTKNEEVKDAYSFLTTCPPLIW